MLAEAFRLLVEEGGIPSVRLMAAGYLGAGDRPYLETIRSQLAEWGLADRFEYVGELDRAEKIAFLQSLDVMSVPTVYPESKGLSILEAWANAVPVVLPDHGVFPELIEDTGGGLLCEPSDPASLDRYDDLLIRLERSYAGPIAEYDDALDDGRDTLAGFTIFLQQQSSVLVTLSKGLPAEDDARTQVEQLLAVISLRLQGVRHRSRPHAGWWRDRGDRDRSWNDGGIRSAVGAVFEIPNPAGLTGKLHRAGGPLFDLDLPCNGGVIKNEGPHATTFSRGRDFETPGAGIPVGTQGFARGFARGLQIGRKARVDHRTGQRIDLGLHALGRRGGL